MHEQTPVTLTISGGVFTYEDLRNVQKILPHLNIVSDLEKNVQNHNKTPENESINLSKKLLFYLSNKDLWKKINTMQEHLPGTHFFVDYAHLSGENFDENKSFAHISKLSIKQKQVVEKLFHNVEILFIHLPYITDRIQPFLHAFPQLEAYKKLVLSQQIVQSYLKTEVLFKNPHIITGALQTSFEEYKRLYFQVLLKEYQTYSEEVRQAKKKQESTEIYLFALQKIEQIPGLNQRKHPLMERSWSHFWTKHIHPIYPAKEAQTLLAQEGALPHFFLGKKFYTKEAIDMCKTIKKAFQEAIKVVKKKAIKGIVQNEKHSTAKKIIDLLQLSDLSKLAELLTEDESGQVEVILQQLLHEGNMNPTG